jgi:hypothetical protein
MWDRGASVVMMWWCQWMQVGAAPQGCAPPSPPHIHTQSVERNGHNLPKALRLTLRWGAGSLPSTSPVHTSKAPAVIHLPPRTRCGGGPSPAQWQQ